MKKLLAVALVFALFAGVVFAQDDDEEGSKWKVGFMAQTTRDIMWYTKLSGENKTAWTDSLLPTDNGSITIEYGAFNKGSINFMTGKYIPTPDDRLLLSLSNTGEGYEVYADIALDGWDSAFSGVWNFLENSSADWWVKGNAGMFNAQIGTAGYGGVVNAYGTWNDFIGWNTLSRFGVMKVGLDYVCSDDFRTWNEWGTIFAAGVTPIENIRFSIGTRLDPYWDSWTNYNDPAGSTSSINASFMLNIGSLLNILDIDAFYAVIGKDGNTSLRGTGGKWENTLGVYAGLGLIENLGLSVGYTANFTKFETEAYPAAIADEKEFTKHKSRTFKTPFYSGIDLHVNFTGIEKLGITFNNRVSLASATGEKIATAIDSVTSIVTAETIVLGFEDTTVGSVTNYGVDGSTVHGDGNWLGDGQVQKWFAWEAELKADYSMSENFDISLHLANRFGVFSKEDSYNEVLSTGTKSTDSTSKITNMETRISLTASYSMGSVTFTPGAYLVIDTVKIESSLEVKDPTQITTDTTDAKITTIGFGIPILFKVAF